MKKFNILRLETGKIRLVVYAASYDEAVEKASGKLNCYLHDDYFVEEAKETERMRELQTRVIN